LPPLSVIAPALLYLLHSCSCPNSLPAWGEGLRAQTPDYWCFHKTGVDTYAQQGRDKRLNYMIK